MSGPILIQGAMDVETDWLVSQLEAREEKELGGFRFWRGSRRGVGLVVSRTEIGSIFTACATTLGVRAFTPKLVVNQGVAGSHSPRLHVGDVVVGTECRNINDWMTPERGRGEGTAPFTWEFHDHTGGNSPLVYRADPNWAARFLGAPYSGGKKVGGRLGSGDVFSREVDRILWLAEQGGHLCEDMESIAAFQVCWKLGVPCVGLRIISNNELTGEPYRREVGVALQKHILEVLDGESPT